MLNFGRTEGRRPIDRRRFLQGVSLLGAAIAGSPA
ncbi:MAG: hypothetical protein QOH05_3040, partial [Acetobacteraceae bacterium]|nr:hypothetical protein [Acetobacteraceae bacterium]